MHNPHTKKEYLFLFLPPHYAHQKEAWKVMIHSLLNKNWRHCYRTEDCIAEVLKAHRVLINEFYCPAELRILFKEVSENLGKQHKMEEVIENQTVNLKLNINIKTVVETKYIKKIILLNQEHRLKDFYRFRLQRKHMETCAPVYRYILGTDKVMVACQRPKI